MKVKIKTSPRTLMKVLLKKKEKKKRKFIESKYMRRTYSAIKLHQNPSIFYLRVGFLAKRFVCLCFV